MDLDDIAVRRRRALFRATHRGTKEMDWFLGKFADARLDSMDGATLSEFERLLSLPDPDLNAWILTPDLITQEDLAPLIEEIRVFHGLGAQSELAHETRELGTDT